MTEVLKKINLTVSNFMLGVVMTKQVQLVRQVDFKESFQILRVTVINWI